MKMGARRNVIYGGIVNPLDIPKGPSWKPSTYRCARSASIRTALSGRWVPPDIRDTIVDFVRLWSDKTEIAADRFVAWIGMARGKFFAWKKRYGKANEHNGHVPRDH
jgi:hypothetical protein